MFNWLERTELILDKESLNKLKRSHVLIVGLGGIGSFAAEFIARAGVGQMTIIDGDVFDPTNKNRQLTALDSTIGKNKAEVLAERLRDINGELKLNVLNEFVLPERVWKILEEFKPDYVMDCIDSVTPKLEWIIACKRLKIKIIAHLGAGGKTDPTRVKVTNLHLTHNCKLASHLKKRLRKKGVEYKTIRAVFSSELQQKSSLKMTNGLNFKRSFYGTVSYMPALFGLIGAADVLRYLMEHTPTAENEILGNERFN
jgi:tRNA A37 threonylcarbamoyladenosine dehydratase